MRVARSARDLGDGLLWGGARLENGFTLQKWLRKWDWSVAEMNGSSSIADESPNSIESESQPDRNVAIGLRCASGFSIAAVISFFRAWR